jgi:hypothetical protein
VNSKYDHTSTVLTGANWAGGRIFALLFENADFDSTHTTIDQVKSEGGVQRNIAQIPNRSVGPDGEALGVSAQFNVTPKGSPYQVVLAWDQGPGKEMAVLAFYDEDEAEGEIALQNNGTLIVRPMDFDPDTGLGTWFLF